MRGRSPESRFSQGVVGSREVRSTPREGKHLSSVQVVGMEEKNPFRISTVIQEVSLSARRMMGRGRAVGWG